MQLVSNRKHLGLSGTLILSVSLITSSLHGLDCTTKNVIGFTAFTTALVSFVHLVTKKTQPVRVEPLSDSALDVAWYVFDELLTGQMEKGERPSKVVFNEDNGEFKIEYSKIEPRGVTGVIYSKMKPVIIPALTLMVLFNKDLKDKLIDNIIDLRNFVKDPTKPFSDIYEVIKTGTKPA